MSTHEHHLVNIRLLRVVLHQRDEKQDLLKPLVNADLTIFPNIYLVRSFRCPYIWPSNNNKHRRR